MTCVGVHEVIVDEENTHSVLSVCSAYKVSCVAQWSNECGLWLVGREGIIPYISFIFH